MITVTESAKEQAIKLMNEENLTNPFIRVGVKGGGCSGLSYDLSFDDKLNEGDQEFEDKGVKIVFYKKSFIYIFLQRYIFI